MQFYIRKRRYLRKFNLRNLFNTKFSRSKVDSLLRSVLNQRFYYINFIEHEDFNFITENSQYRPCFSTVQQASYIA